MLGVTALFSLEVMTPEWVRWPWKWCTQDQLALPSSPYPTWRE